jgi:hypothetical protein
MSIAAPRVIQSSNISKAWGRMFLDALKVRPRCQSPVVLCLAGFSRDLPDEDVAIRQAVDDALSRYGKNDVAVSGMTIFPYDLWRHRGYPSWKTFHTLCVTRFFPRLKACDARNQLGTYFERMMNFTG